MRVLESRVARQVADDGTHGKRFVVARADELSEGERMLVDVGGRTFGVFKIDGEYFALLHRCPHMGGPLCLGEILGLVESSGPGDVRLDVTRKLLTCPLHGWEFDIRTGASYIDPTRVRARCFPVELTPGAVLAEEADADETGRVRGPFTAETFPVSVEDDYVVVTVGRANRK